MTHSIANKEQQTLSDKPANWMDVMPHNYDGIEIDEDCPEYDPGYFTQPVHRFKGRNISKTIDSAAMPSFLPCPDPDAFPAQTEPDISNAVTVATTE